MISKLLSFRSLNPLATRKFNYASQADVSHHSCRSVYLTAVAAEWFSSLPRVLEMKHPPCCCLCSKKDRARCSKTDVHPGSATSILAGCCAGCRCLYFRYHTCSALCLAGCNHFADALANGNHNFCYPCSINGNSPRGRCAGATFLPCEVMRAARKPEMATLEDFSAFLQQRFLRKDMDLLERPQK